MSARVIVKTQDKRRKDKIRQHSMRLTLMYFLWRKNPAGSMREYARFDKMSLHPSNSYPTADPGPDSRVDLL